MWQWYTRRNTIFILSLVALALIAVNVYVPKPKAPPPRQLDLACEPKLESRVQEVLSQWVYDHSTRISRATCKEIVFEARKTNKSLLILGLLTIESELVPTAISPKGAIGISQVMPGVWEKHLITKGIIKERRDLFDVGPSIAACDEILSSCLKQNKGDTYKALESYLGGQDGAYVKKILNFTVNLWLVVEEVK